MRLYRGQGLAGRSEASRGATARIGPTSKGVSGPEKIANSKTLTELHGNTESS